MNDNMYQQFSNDFSLTLANFTDNKDFQNANVDMRKTAAENSKWNISSSFMGISEKSNNNNNKANNNSELNSELSSDPSSELLTSPISSISSSFSSSQPPVLVESKSIKGKKNNNKKSSSSSKSAATNQTRRPSASNKKKSKNNNNNTEIIENSENNNNKSRSRKKQKMEGVMPLAMNKLEGMTSEQLEDYRKNHSLSPDQEKDFKKYLRKIKNRESAILSRQRRKAYQEDLEDKKILLEKENINLERDLIKLEAQNEVLKTEFLEFQKMITNTGLGQMLSNAAQAKNNNNNISTLVSSFANNNNNNNNIANINANAMGLNRSQKDTLGLLYIFIALHAFSPQLASKLRDITAPQLEWMQQNNNLLGPMISVK